MPRPGRSDRAFQACDPRALPSGLETAVDRLFHGLSNARGARIFHPEGAAFEAGARITTTLPGTSVFRAGAEHDAVIRFSRALGVPSPWPDLLGIAIRLGDRQDVLLATSSTARFARYVPRPATSFFDAAFTGLLPFAAGARRVLIGARVEADERIELPGQLRELRASAARGPVRVVLSVAPVGWGWSPLGVVTVGRSVSEETAASLGFDPWHCEGGLVPPGWINAVRAPAYRASRRGRAGRSGSA